MKLQKILFLSLIAMMSLTTAIQTPAQSAPSGKAYQQMSATERATFVAEQARRIGREMSGSEYEFTPEFVTIMQKAVDEYAGRISGDRAAKNDLRPVLERGQAQAPTLIAAFRARNVSPLIGLYLPMIESAYVNIQTPNSMGAIGMFQFLPQTGKRFGLSPEDLLDIGKSADAAARYITKNLELFKADPMKEALALLAYNRGEQRTADELKLFVNDKNRQCSICALTAAKGQLDATFRNESVHYVPSFFAAAIIGENPQAFGLQMQPLSTF